MFVIIYSARQIQPSMDTIANFLYFTLTLYSVVILIFLDKLKQHNFQKKITKCWSSHSKLICQVDRVEPKLNLIKF